jgi:hypothetical protein
MGTLTRRIWLVLALTVFGVCYAPSVVGWWAQPAEAFSGRRARFDASDFGAFYSAAEFVANGRGDRIFHVDDLVGPQHEIITLPDGHVLPYLNPPFFAGALAPLTRLGFDRAYQAWVVLTLGVLVVTCYLLWQTAAPLDRRWRALIIVGFVTLNPLAYSVRQGQFSLILVAALASAYLLLRDGKDRRAGVALAVLLIKPELLVPAAIMLAVARRWRVFETLLPLTAAAVVASIAIVGIPEALRYPRYVHDIAGTAGVGTFTAGMFGWNGLLGSTFGDAHAGEELLAHVPLTLASLALVAYAWRRRPAAEPAFARCWFMMVAGTLLADPHLYFQDVIIVVPAAVGVVATMRQQVVGAGALVAGWMILALDTRPNLEWHVNAFALYVAFTFGMVAIAELRGRGLMSAAEPDVAEAALPRAA